MHITWTMIFTFLALSALVTSILVAVSTVIFFSIPYAGLAWPLAVLIWICAIVLVGFLTYLLGTHTTPALMKVVAIVAGILSVIVLLVEVGIVWFVLHYLV